MLERIIDRGDVIQVLDDVKDWEGCLMVVDKVHDWGVQAGMRLPGEGYTFLRLRWGQFERVGESFYWFDKEGLN